MMREITRFSSLMPAFLAAITALSVPVAAQPLEQFLWENRPLVIFAPNDTDTRLLNQRAMLVAHIEGLRDRDMVVIAVIGSEKAMPELGPRPQASANAFRERFDVSADDFTVILVGKDGTEKARSTAPVLPEAVFQIIDRMPMRQREMRERES